MVLLTARHEQRRDIADINTLTEVAQIVDLDLSRFQKDLSDRQLLAKLAQDHTYAVEQLSIFGTPTLVFAERQAIFLKISPPPPPKECLPFFTELRQLAEHRENVQEIKRP